jgi:hypothetical protein
LYFWVNIIMLTARRKSSSRIALNALGLVCSVPLALALAQIHPALGLAIPGIIAGYLACKSIPLLKTRRGQISAAVALALAVLFATEPASAAIEFSLLFGKTEEMLKTCIFDQVAGFSIATFLMIAPLRLMFIVPIGMNLAEFNKKRNQRQDVSDEVMAIAWGIVTILVVGVIEPLCVKSCG